MRHGLMPCCEGEKSFFVGLSRLAADLERQVNSAENLSSVAAGVAGLMGCSRCIIMLSREGVDFRVAGVYPAVSAMPQGTFLASLARYTTEAAEPILCDGSVISSLPGGISAEPLTGGFLAAPIFSNHAPAGVLFLDGPEVFKEFTRNDAFRLGAVGLVLGMSMQVTQLQSLLQSKFAQIALAVEHNHAGRNPGEAVNLDTGRAARIVARSFYKEMTKAGFSSEDVISAATEILSLLGNRVKKYNRHLWPSK